MNIPQKGKRIKLICWHHYPFTAQRAIYGTFGQNFDFHISRDHQKNVIWASRLWVGRREEAIWIRLCPETRRKKNLGSNRIKVITFWSQLDSKYHRSPYWDSPTARAKSPLRLGSLHCLLPFQERRYHFGKRGQKASFCLCSRSKNRYIISFKKTA